MKPTGKQIAAVNSIVSIVKTWSNTNDITSPTHFADIREFLYADLCDVCTDEQLAALEGKLSDLLLAVRGIKQQE